MGHSNLAVVTTTAVSNLMAAANKAELSNVAIVVSDLSATAYTNTGTGVLAALSDLDQETNRCALNIEPVATQGNEVFEILKKRLFEKLPENAAIDAVATLTDLLINVIASDTEETIYYTLPSGQYRTAPEIVTLSETLTRLVPDGQRSEFKRRLSRHGVPTGKWTKSGMTPLDRNLGKELVLLCWADEDCGPVLIPNALRNWVGLSPEERWWLSTMTDAATGQAVGGRNKGWRKAVRCALTENPIADSVIKRRGSDFELTLFSDLD